MVGRKGRLGGHDIGNRNRLETGRSDVLAGEREVVPEALGHLRHGVGVVHGRVQTCLRTAKRGPGEDGEHGGGVEVEDTESGDGAAVQERCNAEQRARRSSA